MRPTADGTRQVVLLAFSLVFVLGVGVAIGFPLGHKVVRQSPPPELLETRRQNDVLAAAARKLDADLATAQVRLDDIARKHRADTRRIAELEGKLARAPKEPPPSPSSPVTPTPSPAKPDRRDPEKASLKLFLTDPSPHLGHAVRFDRVEVDGELIKVCGADSFSPTLYSEDGRVFLGNANPGLADLAFLMDGELAKQLTAAMESGFRYRANVFGDVTKKGRGVTVQVWRVELLDIQGGVRDSYE